MATQITETLRLLVVSTEPSVLRLLGLTARSNDWHLETSASGWDAMEQVQSGMAPNLVLLDIPHRGGEGLHLLPWLRRLRPELPIVVLCDRADAAKQKEATRLGAKDVLLRPFSERQFESAIQRHFGLSNDTAEGQMVSEDIE
jgi:DNA-binding response OmpR family regulator